MNTTSWMLVGAAATGVVATTLVAVGWLAWAVDRHVQRRVDEERGKAILRLAEKGDWDRVDELLERWGQIPPR